MVPNFNLKKIALINYCGNLFTGLDKGECTEEDIAKAKRMVPKSLDYFVESKL